MTLPMVGLYVATEAYPVKQQYEESQQALKLLEDNGLDGKISVRRLSSKAEFDRTSLKEGFEIISISGKTSLPFLACFYSEAGVFDGYSGIEDIIQQLDDLELLEKAEK